MKPITFKEHLIEEEYQRNKWVNYIKCGFRVGDRVKSGRGHGTVDDRMFSHSVSEGWHDDEWISVTFDDGELRAIMADRLTKI